MKPKPFSLLNHFTIPVSVCIFLQSLNKNRHMPNRRLSRCRNLSKKVLCTKTGTSMELTSTNLKIYGNHNTEQQKQCQLNNAHVRINHYFLLKIAMTKLPREFYSRTTLDVAHDLLGKLLVKREIGRASCRERV